MKKRIVPALVLSLFATFGATQSNAAQFSNVVVFGDSLSDAGYFRPFLTQIGLPPALVATLGRFTINPGPVWSELVSQHYGVQNPGASNAGGFIYAQGGARVTQPSASTPPGSAQRPVSTQINEFLASSNGVADPNALYAVFAGGNDMLQNLGLFQAGQITQAQLQANVLQAATDDVAQVARLRAAGARYILVFALPDVGGTPSAAAGGPAVAGAVTQLSAGYNTTLFTGLASAGIRAIPVDTFGLFTDVKNNAAAFGFTNTTGIACLPFPPVSATPSSQFCTAANIVPGGQTYLFADSVHPTPAAQAILAQYVESLIDGPSQYSMLPETAIHARQAHVRSLAEGVRTGLKGSVGTWTTFISYNNSDPSFDARQGIPQQDTDSYNFAVGASMRASENVVVGLAYGQSNEKARFGGNAGGYKMTENTLSAFAGYQGANLYASAALSIGNLEYSENRRNIQLGPVTRTGESSPSGSNASFYANVGYDFVLGKVRVGPYVTLGTQSVDVNGFSETPSGGAPNTGMLSISKQTRRSEVWSIGAQASMDFGNWTPWIRFQADKERRDDPRFVSAQVQSLGPTGLTYDIEAYKPDSTYMTTSVGIRGNITPSIGLGIAYYNISGREGSKDDGITAALAFRF